jgi:alkanesulfonate monooxygenase SsuD/methylene tetrahydromethanopterin reductase-like flavin-dependent oxidoreductase (luciferase family)
MMTPTWRVVTGSLRYPYDPHGDWEWTWGDANYRTFDEATEALLGILDEFVDDNRGGCEHCVSQGDEARRDLTVLPAGEEFHGEVDGRDYCLLRR